MKGWGGRLGTDNSIRKGRQTNGWFASKAISIGGVAFLVLSLAACGGSGSVTSTGQGPEPATDTTISVPTSPTTVGGESVAMAVTTIGSDESQDPIAVMAHALGNLTYEGVAPTGAISLTDGWATYDDGSSGNPSVQLLDEFVAAGDLNGDGVVDGIAVLMDNSSGSGRFTYLVAVLNALTDPTPTGALLLGDRVQLKSLSLDGAQVVVDLVTQGPADPLCCPTARLREVFSVTGGQLVLRSSENMSDVAPSDSNDTK